MKIGDKVSTGAPLIEFDLDYLATHAKSLLTQIVITNGERLTTLGTRDADKCVAGKDVLFSVAIRQATEAAAQRAGETITSDAIVIPNPTGLHARPAAVLASMAKQFKSAIKLQLGDRQANARSVTSIMALDVRRGAVVHLLATGPDARAAVDKTRADPCRKGCGDEGCVPAPAPQPRRLLRIPRRSPRRAVRRSQRLVRRLRFARSRGR